MTTLYRLNATAAQIGHRFGASVAAGDPWIGGTIAPGSFAPVVTPISSLLLISAILLVLDLEIDLLDRPAE